jgi:predicted transcriptional regulator
MIDFACKKFELDEVIKCSLNLTKSEYKIMRALMKSKDNCNSSDLASSTKLDITTIQRSLKTLYEKNLVGRSQMNLNNGGYTYNYRIKDKIAIRKIILEIIHGWTRTVEKELEKW